MKLTLNSSKIAFGVCLVFSQLFAFHGAWASSAMNDEMANPSQFNTVSTLKEQKKQKKKNSKFLLFDQPNGGDIQISGSAGYTASIYNLSTAYQATIYNSKSDSKGFDSDISAAYGFTDNFYSKVTLSYSNSRSTQSTSSYNTTTSSPDSVSTSDGLREPTFLLGTQFQLGATQIFAEFSTNFAIGDKITKKTSATETSDNNLNGGMSYSPHLGIVHDLGDVLLMGGASYTFEGDRNERQDNIGNSFTNKVKGGNSTNLISGIEFKNLSRLGFAAGYSKSESKDSISGSTNQLTTSPGQAYAVALAYMGIKVGPEVYLIPKLMYATELDTQIASGGTLTTINQFDVWKLSMGARVNF
ncbi:MAG: hypothetical protein ACXVCY_13715 [Pseudobdellovibrionaceae bacterium]